MTTIRLFAAKSVVVPLATTWLLADLAEFRGRQELFTRQSPQRLKALREHAMIESAISSNRIEGVEIDSKRVRPVLFGKPALHDRNEEEVRGYRDALRTIHESWEDLPIAEKTIRDLHRISRNGEWDAGAYKKKNVDIIETYADGSSRVRFKSVPASRKPAAMKELVRSWNSAIEARRIPPLLASLAINLDFLCIHPFRDGNGRVSRLLLALQCAQLGYEVGRYISLERTIEQNKERYYETLELSSRFWHEGRHDPWPYINYLLFVLATAYKEFEVRAGQTKAPRGEKSAVVAAALRLRRVPFTLADLQRDCPGVSVDMIRHMLNVWKKSGKVVCLGRGRSARWQTTNSHSGKNGSKR